MARKLASIVEIASCDPIPDTDRLSVTMMKGKGWKVVTGRDEFKPGDLAVYFEVDSYLPSDDERYAFLHDRCLRKFVSKSGQILKVGVRIKTCKLRGVISQGLLMPIANFPEITDNIVDAGDGSGREIMLVSDKECPGSTKGIDVVDADVTEMLKVQHFDEIAEALRPATEGGNPIASDAMGKFPTDFIPKTDEERIQNLSDYWITMKGRQFEITEKRDGSSVTMFYSERIDPENPFGVCSRNLRLKPCDANGKVPLPWKMAAKYGVEEKLRNLATDGHEFAFQGELVGPGVNGNRDLLTDWEWQIFKIWDITDGEYLTPDEARVMCESVGLTYVPVICEYMDVFDTFPTVDDLLKFAEGKTARGNEREGLVFKSTTRPYVSFKAVSNKYLLKQK